MLKNLMNPKRQAARQKSRKMAIDRQRNPLSADTRLPLHHSLENVPMKPWRRGGYVFYGAKKSGNMDTSFRKITQ